MYCIYSFFIIFVNCVLENKMQYLLCNFTLELNILFLQLNEVVFMKRYLTLLRLVPILVLFAVLSANANREIGNYPIVQTVQNEYPSVPGTDLTSPAASDQISAVFDIGFNFLVDSVFNAAHTATRFQVHTNGMIVLLDASQAAATATSTPISIARAIVPFYSTNLKSKTGYKLLGTAPNRVLVVYWDSLKSKVAAAPETNAQMQVRLYETSNKIEFVYGQNMTLLPTTGTHSVLDAYISMTGRLSGRFLGLTPTATGVTPEFISSGTKPKQITAANNNLQYLTNGKTYTLYRATTPEGIYPVSGIYSKTGSYNTLTKQPGVSIIGNLPASVQLLEYSIVGPSSSANPTAVYTAKTADGINSIIPITSTTANPVMSFTNATGSAVGVNGALNYAAMTPGIYTVNLKINDAGDIYTYSHTMDVVLDKDISLTNISSPIKNSKYALTPAGVPVSFEVENIGNTTVESFSANVKIYFESESTPVYDQTQVVTPANFTYRATHTVNFPSFVTTRSYGKYRVVATTTLDGDLDLSNNRMPRAESEEYAFFISRPLDIATIDIVSPLANSVLGRPINPSVLIKNNGLDDISLPVSANIKITKLSDGQTVADFNQIVESIPAYPNDFITEVAFEESVVLTQAGSYRVLFTINAPGDEVASNNTIEKIINVANGLVGTYKVGTSLPSANYATIQAAVADMYQKGISGSVTFELVDPSYNVTALNINGPALDLSSAIVGNDENNYIKFTPSEDLLAANTPINISLNSNNGIGVLFGQSTSPANSQAPIHSVYSSKKKMFANAAGYIVFDGGEKKNIKFTLISNSNFRAGIYLGQGASYNTIKNCRIADHSSNPADGTVLPGSRYNATSRNFEFEQNSSYTAGIVLKSITPYNKAQYPMIVNNNFNLDTLVNAHNVIENNIIDGFAYGITSMGIGVLQRIESSTMVHTSYYNHDNIISKNLINNSKKAGIFLGFEKNSKVEYNRIDGVVSTNTPAYGITLGGERNDGYFPYNTSNILIQGNEISNINSPIMACGINVISARNEYYNSDYSLTLFTPEADEMSLISSNAIWNINSIAYRIGINLTTERGNSIYNPLLVGYKSKNNAIVNNTIRIEEDGNASSTSKNACINLSQVQNTKVINNALLINDNTYTTGSAALIHLVGQMPETDMMYFNRNVYYYAANPTTDLVRFYETNDKDVIFTETGVENEYKQLTQWQYWTKQDQQSSWYNFSGELSVNANKMRITSNPINSKLYDNGMSYRAVSMNNGLTLAEYIPNKDVDGNTRGIANTRFDIGANEFFGRTYDRDIEVVKISEPIAYRSTNAPFNDVNYIMTKDTVNIKAIVKNNSNSPLSGVEVKAYVYKENADNTYPVSGISVFSYSAYVDIPANDFAEVDFKTTGGTVGVNPFLPETYERSNNYVVPAKYAQMFTTVTPKYKIKIEVSDPMDQNTTNNLFADEFRFFLRKSELSFLISAENTNLDLNATETVFTKDQIAGKLNYDSLEQGIKNLGWKQTKTVEGRGHDYDVFNRSVWEPRAVNYSIYKNLFWAEGAGKATSRLQVQDIEKFAENTEYSIVNSAKKNLICASEELIRKNIADFKPFLNTVFRVDSLYPNTPMGLNGLGELLPYNNDTILGVSLARGKAAVIKATGFAGDDLPYPALMTIVPTGSGLALPAYHYVNPDENISNSGLATGITVSAQKRNVIYLGQDWRHFAKLDDVLRGIVDYLARNGGTIEPIVVPIELTDFDAFDRNKKVEISWVTASEYNSDRFEIERAEETEAGTTAFKTIAIESAAGNSNSMRTYGPIIDKNVDYGRSYIYRLKSVDVDGESSLSNEVEVAIENFFGVNPNPATTVSSYTFNLGESQNVEIELYDINGKMVKAIYNGVANANHTVEINVSDLVNGTYTIVTKTANQIYTTALYVRK